jgi:HTH-type transcriptional regulator/antitoxin MqsA
MYKDNDKCPICGEGILKRKEITETFEYKGEKFKIPNYVIFECGTCDESIVDRDTLKTSEKTIRDFQRRVDGLLTSNEIKKIRKAYGFTQEAIGKLLGGGAKAFARYETGKVSQSKAMDNLLRIIDAIPDALDVLFERKDEEKTRRTYRLLDLPKYDHKNPEYFYNMKKVVGE